MTAQISLTALGNNVETFKAAVETHIAKLHAFNKTVGKPRPTAAPEIEACIKRVQTKGAPDTYTADYVIVDDTPPPPTLVERKLALRKEVIASENEAKFRILPEAKMRLTTLKMQRAAAKPEEERSAEEREDLASYLRVVKVWEDIAMWGAQAEFDIDDLTEDNIDSWQTPIFG